ncbi:MAG: hypothetical protein K2G87_09865 [Oscillospiraceae bacterium]|nr:hypothetical protein [Oscillospiraceae bacterium]
METIKKSLEKNFLPVFIFSLIMGLVSAVLGKLGTFGSLITLVALPPLYIGFYRFLFSRMEDGNPEISSIFNFYKSGQTFGKSFLMYNLGGLILGALLVIVILSMITSILMSLNSDVDVGGTIGTLLIVVLLFVIAAVFFRLMPYLYAYNKIIEVGWSLKTSFKLGAKYLYIFLGIDLLFGILSMVIAFISLGITSLEALTDFVRMVSENRNYTPSTGILSTIIGWVISAGSKWATFTAAYMIFQREYIQRENLGDMY